MDVVLKDVTYPANIEEWFAKGNADVLGDDTYFEVPAIFAEDGSCNETATQLKITVVLNYILQRKLGSTPTN